MMEFASKNFTIGQLNSAVKKLGGEEAARHFLRGELEVEEATRHFLQGELEVEEVENTLLESLGLAIVSATKKKFVAKKKFIVDTGDKAKVRISYLGDNFKEWFLDKIEEPIKKIEFHYSRLTERSVDEPIIKELGGEEKAETSLTGIFSLMEMQKNGGDGVLLNNGYANIFYVRDTARVLHVVRTGWCCDGWCVDAYSVESPDGWGVGRQFFSCNS